MLNKDAFVLFSLEVYLMLPDTWVKAIASFSNLGPVNEPTSYVMVGDQTLSGSFFPIYP